MHAAVRVHAAVRALPPLLITAYGTAVFNANAQALIFAGGGLSAAAAADQRKLCTQLYAAGICTALAVICRPRITGRFSILLGRGLCVFNTKESGKKQSFLVFF